MRGYLIKPCPFCASLDVHLNNAWPHYVYCLGCGATVKSLDFGEDGEKNAVEKWNTRKETIVDTVICVTVEDWEDEVSE